MISHTYISFLRGINVSGHNLITMTDLTALYRNLRLKGAETYIQSGNVIFCTDEGGGIQDISQKIESAIFKKFKLDVPVLIRTPEEIKKLVSVNPFLSLEKFEPSKMAVIFLKEELVESQIQKIINIDYPPDKFVLNGSEIFIYCPNGFGRTKLTTNFFERKMGVIGTARNWNTFEIMLGMAERMSC